MSANLPQLQCSVTLSSSLHLYLSFFSGKKSIPKCHQQYDYKAIANSSTLYQTDHITQHHKLKHYNLSLWWHSKNANEKKTSPGNACYVIFESFHIHTHISPLSWLSKNCHWTENHNLKSSLFFLFFHLLCHLPHFFCCYFRFSTIPSLSLCVERFNLQCKAAYIDSFNTLFIEIQTEFLCFTFRFGVEGNIRPARDAFQHFNVWAFDFFFSLYVCSSFLCVCVGIFTLAGNNNGVNLGGNLNYVEAFELHKKTLGSVKITYTKEKRIKIIFMS